MTDVNRFLNHDVRIAQLENNALRQYVAPSLGEALRQIRGILADIEDVNNLRELLRLERAINAVIRSESGWALLNQELTEFAQFESELLAGVVGAGTTAANANKINQLARNTMLVLRSGERFDSGLWPDFIEANLDYQSRQVNNLVRAGYANGVTAKELRKQVSSLFNGALMRNAEAMVRTGYSHYATIGSRAFADENSDIIDREVPIITFDNRTSETCLSIGARYGQNGWPVGDSPIGYPPYHWKCRTRVAYLTPGQSLTGTRATAKGQVPVKTTIDEFFKRQDREWLDKALGPERAKLFLADRIELRDLTNAQLQPLTLDELRELGD